MLYSVTIDTPANTSPLAPMLTTARATSGIITQGEFYLPPGSSGLMGVQVRQAEYQFMPVDRNEWIKGDNVNLSYNIMHPIDTAPFDVEIYTYNLDEQYDHEMQFRFVLLSTDAFLALHGQGISAQDLESVMKDIATQTSQANKRVVSDAFGVIKDGN